MCSEPKEFTPYPWQTNALSAWIQADCRGIVDVVTGAGKTYFAMMAISHLKAMYSERLCVFVVVPTVNLMEQWERSLRRFFQWDSDEVGKNGSGCIAPPNCQVQLFVVNSARSVLASRREAFLSTGDAVLLVADECHHYASPHNREIFRGDPTSNPRYFTLGLSATPYCPQFEAVLKPQLGPVLYQYSHGEALKEEVVSPFFIRQIAVPFDGEELEAYANSCYRVNLLYSKLSSKHKRIKETDGDGFFAYLQMLVSQEDDTAVAYHLEILKRREIVCMAKSRILCTVDLLHQLEERSRVIVFCERVIQAEQAARELRKHFPFQVSIYHSQLHRTQKQRELSAFRQGDARILVACRALDEGMDVPDADVAVILSGRIVERQRIQRLGRILRKNDPEKVAALYFLYIKGSSEDGCFLPDGEKHTQIAMRYFPEEHAFSCPFYENVALEILEMLQKQNAAPQQIKEARRCLMEGMLRPDWQRELCSKPAISTKQEENYWKCMQWVFRRVQKIQEEENGLRDSL